MEYYPYTRGEYRFYALSELIDKDAPTTYRIEEVLEYIEGDSYDYIRYVHKVAILENELFTKSTFFDDAWHQDTELVIDRIIRKEEN